MAYEYLYVFEAARPQNGQTSVLALYFNKDSVNAFFREFEKEVGTDVHIIMIWDQAGFHTYKNVQLPDNVTRLSLPP